MIMEPVRDGTESKMMKKATLSLNLPGWSGWEVFVDEGAPGGGTDEAPSPLGYLSIGVAACLMTHLSGVIQGTQLEIKSIKIEQRVRFHSTYNFADTKPEDTFGYTEGLETNVVIDSDEPTEKLQQLVDLAQQACMALNSFLSRVPTETKVFVNGEEL